MRVPLSQSKFSTVRIIAQIVYSLYSGIVYAYEMLIRYSLLLDNKLVKVL